MPDPVLRPDPDAEWQALLAQLRQQATVQPAPFFYARVRARLLARTAAGSSWLLRQVQRAVVAAGLAALVLAVSGDGATAAPGYAPVAGATHRPAGR